MKSRRYNYRIQCVAEERWKLSSYRPPAGIISTERRTIDGNKYVVIAYYEPVPERGKPKP